MRNIILFILIAFCGLSVNAQEVSVVESQKLKTFDQRSIEIIGQLGSHYMTLVMNERRAELTSLDSNLRVEKQLQINLSNGSQFIDYYTEKDTFYVFHKAKEENFYKILCYKITENAKILDTIEVFKEPYFYGSASYFLYQEPHCPRVAIMRKDPALGLKVYHLSRSDLDKLNVSVIDLSYLNKEYSQLHACGSKKGDIFIASMYNRLSWRKSYSLMEIAKLSDPSGKIVKIKLDDVLLNSSSFDYNLFQDNLSLAGFYSKENVEVNSGTYQLIITHDATDWKVHTRAFNDQIVEQMYPKRPKNKSFIPNMVVRDVILRSDGGIVMVSEYEKIVFKQAGMNMTGVALAPESDHFNKNILIQALDQDFYLNWEAVFFKNQYSKNDQGYYSSFYMHREPSAIHFLFNDEIVAENTISHYLIDASGNSARSHFLIENKPRHKLILRHAKQINSREFLCAEKFGNSSYKILRMSIN